MPGIQLSLQKSTDSDSEKNKELEREKAIKEKCQRLIDYSFGDGPYPISDISGLPGVIRHHVAKAGTHEPTEGTVNMGKVDIKPISNTQETREEQRSVMKVTPVDPLEQVDKINQQNLDLHTEREQKLKSHKIFRFWQESSGKLVFYDPEKAETTAKEPPLKPEPTDVPEKSKNEQQSYEVEKTEEISKENHLKPGFDSAGSLDSTRNERSYDTEKIETTAKKARLEKELLHHFRETGTPEMNRRLDNLYKKNVAAKDTESKPPDLDLIDLKCSSNKPQNTASAYIKKKSLEPNSMKTITRSVEMVCIDEGPYMKYNIFPEIIDVQIGNKLQSKSDTKLLEYIERFRVDPPPLTHGTMDLNSKPRKCKDNLSLLNAETKLREATGVFRQEILKRYILKSTGDGLAHAQKMLIKATNEFCNKIKKESAPSKPILYNTADISRHKKEGRLQAHGKRKLKAARILPDILQMETKYNATRTVISTSLNSTNIVSGISFEPPRSDNAKSELTNATSITPDYKINFQMHKIMPETKTKISDGNAKIKREDKQLIDQAIAKILATRGKRLETKKIDKAAALLMLNELQSREKVKADEDSSALKIKSLTFQAVTPAKGKSLLSSDTREATTNERTREMEEARGNPPYDSSKNVQRNQHIYRPYYDNNWVKQFYAMKYNNPTPGKDSSVKNETNRSEKFTLNSVQSAVRTETNKLNVPSQISDHKMKTPILPADLFGPGETQNKTIQTETESEVTANHKAQKVVTARPKQSSQVNNETEKEIKQSEAKRRCVQLSQLGNIELLLSKTKENPEENVSLSSSIEQKTNKSHNPLTRTRLELDKLPLSELLKVIRARNQIRKASDTAMAVFKTDFVESAPNSSPIKGKKANENLYFPSYRDRANKSGDSLKTE